MISTGAQIRAGRALLNLTRRQLARSARLHPNSIKRWEAVLSIPIARCCAGGISVGEPYAVERIRRALEVHGVETFTQPAPGVRLVP